MTLPDISGKKPDAAVDIKIPVEEAAKEAEKENEEDRGEIDEQDKKWDDLFGIQGGLPTGIKQARLLEMEQARHMRYTLFCKVVRPYISYGALVSFVAMSCLLIAMYVPPWMWQWIYGKNSAPGVVILASSGNSSWPFAAFILGTFATFTAFGAMLLSAVLSSRDKDSKDNSDDGIIKGIKDNVSGGDGGSATSN